MSMDKTYNSMDIKNALHAVDVPIPSESAFRYAKFDSEKAFGRLQTAREIKRALVDGINEYADDLPIELRKQYDKVIRTLKAIEEEMDDLISRQAAIDADERTFIFPAEKELEHAKQHSATGGGKRHGGS